MNKRLQVVDIVVNKVLEDMKDKKRPFWYGLTMLDHYNRWTGKRYKGVNIILLILQGGSGEYITMKQLNQYNKKNDTSYLVKKDTKSLMVTFQKKTVRNAFDYEIESYESGENKFNIFEQDGEYKRSYFVLRYYNVFDLNDIADKDGNPMPRFSSKVLDEVTEGEKEIPPSLTATDPEGMMQEYCNREVILFVNEVCTPHYNDAMDIIKVPEKETFKNPVNYHSVCFHEAVHSTGAEKRINRPSLKEYHRNLNIRGTEELIAEIGANMLLVESGYNIEEIDMDETTDYLASWAMWIENNKESFIYACNAAHKAVDFFLGAMSEGNQYEDVLNFGEIEIDLELEGESLEVTSPLGVGELPIHIEDQLKVHTASISSDPLAEVSATTKTTSTQEEPKPYYTELEISMLKELEEHLSKGLKVIALFEDNYRMFDSFSALKGHFVLSRESDKKVIYKPILSTWKGEIEAQAVLSQLKPEYSYVVLLVYKLSSGSEWSNYKFGSIDELNYKINEFLGQTGNTDSAVYIKEMYAY